ncbi:RUS family member 1 isoform X4 [Melopsittacus undulatus]|uniref:RUS family member 1 isoform X4 n=1 Tax=Melopsittacus undulatus TaxID=13146 RepID=UPI00146A5078|nr:RUS1 family protein C16orf58 homolog isoform X4 [Melopsittacus undulatus]
MEPPEAPPLCRELWGSQEVTWYQGDPRGGLLRLRPPGARAGTGINQVLMRVLLPQGYPHSVSPDYLQYQCWDSLQALCSSLCSSLSARSVLQAMGVGDGAATVTGATLTWLLRDGVGMVTRITFTYLQGSRLDCEAKQWRLAADVINDAALLLELLAPDWPRAGPALLTLAAAGKCVVGVAGGATRTALAVHQARRDNVAEVAAKDSSQETLVNGLGLLLSLLLLPALEGRPCEAELLKAIECSPEQYLIVLRPEEGWVGVGLRRGSPPSTPLLACAHALLLEELLGPPLPPTAPMGAALRRMQGALRRCHAPGSVPWGVLAESSRIWRTLGPSFVDGLAAAGWETQRPLLAPDQWELEWAGPGGGASKEEPRPL